MTPATKKLLRARPATPAPAAKKLVVARPAAAVVGAGTSGQLTQSEDPADLDYFDLDDTITAVVGAGTSGQLTQSEDSDDLDYFGLDDKITRGFEYLRMYAWETEEEVEHLIPYLREMKARLTSQGKRSDLTNTPSGLTWQAWVESKKAIFGSLSTVNRLLAEKRKDSRPWMTYTPDGTLVEVARSAAQKAVRDGDETAGVYWIRQLYLVNRHVWKMLAIFAVEDIGIADLTVKAHILELEQLASKCEDARRSDLLHVITAMMICCRAKKSRAADNACVWLRENPTYTPPSPKEIEGVAKMETVQPAIPDKVYDMHTNEGRRMGRGLEHFVKEAAALTNESDVEPFAPPTWSEPAQSLAKLSDDAALARGKAIAKSFAYLSNFTGTELKARLDEFVHELTAEFSVKAIAAAAGKGN